MIAGQIISNKCPLEPKGKTTVSKGGIVHGTEPSEIKINLGKKNRNKMVQIEGTRLLAPFRFDFSPNNVYSMFLFLYFPNGNDGLAWLLMKYFK